MLRIVTGVNILVLKIVTRAAFDARNSNRE